MLRRYSKSELAEDNKSIPEVQWTGRQSIFFSGLRRIMGHSASDYQLEASDGRTIILEVLPGESPPSAFIDSFDGVDVPFDHAQWTRRTLALAARRKREAQDIS